VCVCVCLCVCVCVCLSLFLVSYCEADVSPEFVRIHVDDHADKVATLTAGTDHTVQIERAKVKFSASIQIENELENKKSKSGDGDSARFAQALLSILSEVLV
jgi:hypothetical protein